MLVKSKKYTTSVYCSQYMTVDEHAKMPTFNLADMVHNKWLQQNDLLVQSVNGRFDLCVHANYRLWLKKVPLVKAPIQRP